LTADILIEAAMKEIEIPDETHNENFEIGYNVEADEEHSGECGTVHVYWSDLSPRDLVAGLNAGEVHSDMGTKYLFKDGVMIGKIGDFPYYGDVFDEANWFLPAHAH
jgi:hypothetical protein